MGVESPSTKRAFGSSIWARHRFSNFYVPWICTLGLREARWLPEIPHLVRSFSIKLNLNPQTPLCAIGQLLSPFLSVLNSFHYNDFFSLSVYLTGPENLAVEAMVCELSFVSGSLAC